MSKKIDIHEKVPNDMIPSIKKQIKKLKINAIDSSQSYSLYKVESKYRPDLDPNREFIIKNGYCQIIGSLSHISLFVSNYRGNYFRTSPIVSVVELEDKIKIETQNSVYELIKE